MAGRILATFAIKATLRAPAGSPDDADDPPTIGLGGAEEDVTSFIPTNDLMVEIVRTSLEQATQLDAGVTSERTDK